MKRMILLVLSIMLLLPVVVNAVFSDLAKNHWAAPYVKVAENYSIMEYDVINEYNIDQPINRIDVIRILSSCDINIRENSQKTMVVLPFSDIDNLSKEETAMLKHAVESGIIGGYPDGTFKPDNNLTRAEASKILSIYMNK